MYDGQIIHQNLKAYAIPEFLFYGGNVGDRNTDVDISGFSELKILSGSISTQMEKKKKYSID